MRMRKRVITGLAAVLTAAVLAGCGSKETVMEQYEDTLAVTIDGKEIMLSDAMYQIFGAEVNGAYYESVYQNYYGVSFWDQEYSDGTGADPVSMRDYMKAQTMDSIIMYEILAMEAEKAGMTLDEDEVSEYRKQIAQLLNQEEESAAEGIEHVGFTEDNLDEEFRILSLAFKYYEYLEEGLSVDEEAIRAGMDFEDYREYLTEYLFLATSYLDENFERVEQTEEEKAAGRETMEEALGMADDGMTFDEIVTAIGGSGLSTGTRNFTRDSVSVDKDYIDAAIVLEVGDHTGVVETDDGYYIIRLTSDDSDTVYETAVEEAVSLAVSEAFYEKYNEIREGYQVVVNSEVWDGLPFGEITLESTGA